MASKKGKKKGFFSTLKEEGKKIYESLDGAKVSSFLKEEFLGTKFKNSLIEIIRTEVKEVRKTIVKSIAFGILLFSGIVMLIVGLAEILARIFPLLSGGYSYFIFGVILVLVAFLIKIWKRN